MSPSKFWQPICKQMIFSFIFNFFDVAQVAIIHKYI
jgi:hypothetical protein